jgi:uncharacterized repeat protein (TIGR04138 family)
MSHISCLDEVVKRDPRYAYESYEFVFAALGHAQNLLGRSDEAQDEEEPDHHVSGPELLAGVRDLALREFGLMARTVFRLWGINRTADVGNIVFNLIESGLMSKTDQDNPADFVDVYDLDEALVEGYRIPVRETE